jgi:protein O-mannosyl-transferase
MAAGKPKHRPAGFHSGPLACGICVALAASVFLVFGQALRNDFVNYDDGQYVFANSHVLKGLTAENVGWAFTRIHCDNWHPLTWLSHMLDCQLYGLNPAGHHLTSLLLHAATAILLFLALLRMTGALGASAFAALIFAVHPLRVESVAWIAERKDVLSGLFFMLTLLAYDRYARATLTKQEAGIEQPASTVFLFSSPWYWLALLCFALGLMSKPMLVTLPFVLLLLDSWPLRRTRSAQSPGGNGMSSSAPASTWPRLILEKIPFLILSAASCTVTLFAQKAAVIPVASLPLAYRLGNALTACTAYLGQMVFPTRLAVLYPHAAVNLASWRAALALGILAGISVVVFRLRRRQPYLLTGWLWNLGMLVPVIGLVQVGFQSHADRYTYLPQIGLYLMLAWAAGDLTASWRYRRLVLWGAAASIITTFAVRAAVQTTVWRNAESLWKHTLTCTGDNPMAQSHLDVTLGHALDEQGRFDEAIGYYQSALRIASGFADAPYLAEAEYDLGSIYAKQNRLGEATAHLREAVRLNPGLPEAFYNLGHVLAAQNQPGEAAECYRRAIHLKPGYPEACCNLARLMIAQKRPAEAVELYEQALASKPDYADARNNLANLLVAQGRFDDAIGHYQKAARTDPRQAGAYYNLAIIRALQGRPEDAIEQYRQALAINPNYLEAHGNLADTLTRLGRLDEAIEHYQRAIQLAPRNAQLRDRLGVAFEGRKKYREAKDQFQEALALQPQSSPIQNNLAWLLATCPETSVRDGARAVQLAGQAAQLTQNRQPEFLDSLAAAYAEAGRFPEAIETANRALALANSAANTNLAQALQAHLNRYLANQPYHEPP